MPKLIDKEKVQTEIALIAKHLAKSDAQKAIIGRILFMIDNMQATEPEVRHGRWLSYTGTHYTGKENEYGDPEYKEHIFFVCSNCRRKTVVRENFCPHCGADMRASDTNDGGKGGAE